MTKFIITLFSIICLSQAYAQSDILKKEPWIAMHLLNFTSDAELEKLAVRIPSYAAKGINLLILEVDYSFQFVSHPELIASEFITPAAAGKFARVCKANNIRLVPEFQCLGHQSWAEWTHPLLTKYPELDLTPGAFPGNQGIYCREWDPTNPKVKELIFPLIEEIVNAFEADGIHVGMDEVFLLGSEKSPNTKGKNPAELFANAVNELHEHFVKNKGLEMFMWGDRLIDGVKSGYGSWEASTNGTAPAVDMIPKDIIICDWHYRPGQAYPSIPMFLEKGFRVLPCSFKDALGAKTLIKFSLRQDHPNMLGHMFTSWGAVSKDSLLLYPAFTEGLEVMKEKKIWFVSVELKSVNSDGTLSITMSADNKNLPIYYTTDGTNPGKNSQQYLQPLALNKTCLIKAVAYYGDKQGSDIVSKSFLLHKATGKEVSFTKESDYPALKGASSMVNGIASTDSYSDGEWAGFEEDIEVIIDFKTLTEITEINLNCFYDPISRIYPGMVAEIWISADGINYKRTGKTKISQSSKTYQVPVKIFTSKAKAKYIKLIIPKRQIPEGVQGAGYPAMIFIDEIVVK